MTSELDKQRTRHTLKLVVATIGQTFLLVAAWGFLGEVLFNNPLYVYDFFAMAMFSNPIATTWVVTLVATGVSVATTTFLTIALREALRHRMRTSISLIHLSAGIALARGSYLFNHRHWPTTLVTLTVFGITKLLVSSWTALLAPTYVTWNVTASGSELDITSNWFESRLQEELVQSGAALVRGNSTQILNLDGVLSGIAAAQYGLGKSGIFEFNGAKYNISTGGILPAAPGYNGVNYTVSGGDSGLAFAGGLVPVNLSVNFTKGQAIQGLNQSFQLRQQGLTADVACRTVDNTTANLNLTSSFYSTPVPFADGSPAYWLWAWNFTGDCNDGQPSHQQIVTQSNSSDTPQMSSTGFLASLVCPALQQIGPTWENFTVVTNASWKYGFLPLTVCTITPRVTTSLVSYANGIMRTTVLNSWPVGSANTNLTQFLAALVDYQARTTQGLTSNSIGDALYSIWISLSASGFHNSQDILVREMEQYWRGVVEFSGTFLRSGFSAYPLEIPIEARIPLSGHLRITSMGWYRRSSVWGYTIIPITIVALMIYIAVIYTVCSVFSERRAKISFTKFDPTNPIHLMMASSTKKGDQDTSRNVDLDHELEGSGRGGVGKNENVKVELSNDSKPGHPHPMVAPSTEKGDQDTSESIDLGDELEGFWRGGVGKNENVKVELKNDSKPDHPGSRFWFEVPPKPSLQGTSATA